MTETTTPAPADAITPANILAPASVPPPVPAPESKPAPATPDAAPDQGKEGPVEETASTDKDETKRKSARDRIDELTAHRRAAERRAAESAREAMALRRQLQEMQAKVSPDDWQQQQRVDIQTAVKEDRVQQLETEAQRAAIDAHELRARSWETKIDQARERIPDLDAALQTFANLPVSDYAADIIAESDKSAEITYYLAKHPSEAQRIANLPPHQQGRELARIEAKVSPGQARRTSNAPPPVPVIGTNTAPSAPALRDMGVAEIGKLLGYGSK